MVTLSYLKVWHVGNSFKFIRLTVLLSHINQLFYLFLGYNIVYKLYKEQNQTCTTVLFAYFTKANKTVVCTRKFDFVLIPVRFPRR